MFSSFGFYRTPKIVFGPDEINRLPSLVVAYGKKILIVHGSRSLTRNNVLTTITQSLSEKGATFYNFQISGEPSPQLIDQAVQEYAHQAIDCVVGIGGGSVIDAGKAISAMLTCKTPVTEFLEVVGTRKPDGNKVAFIAIPTTSGTGSEASANAVLSEIGPSGFKRSLRHDNYVPDIALIDPKLTLSCPPDITAACGMDALTQLMESYVSVRSSPFTDALNESAFPLVRDHLGEAVFNGENNLDARSGMSYASMTSGITLANAGLGVVHGLASVLGALHPIPHGVVCGTLLASAVKHNLKKLLSIDSESIAVKKYAAISKIFHKIPETNNTELCYMLISYLESLTATLSIPKLSSYGVTISDFGFIDKENCNKNNPVQLSSDEIRELLIERL